MGKLILVTGGARSGKSGYAESLAAALGEVTYIATAIPFDAEMQERIRLHRGHRPSNWKTIEAYRDLGSVLADLSGAVLLDCMTIMVSNLMMDSETDWDNPNTQDAQMAEAVVNTQINDLLAGVNAMNGTLIIVTNELGMGLVPVYPFGRIFRDIAGRVNQRLARMADEAWFMVSGIPMRLK